MTPINLTSVENNEIVLALRARRRELQESIEKDTRAQTVKGLATDVISGRIIFQTEKLNATESALKKLEVA